MRAFPEGGRVKSNKESTRFHRAGTYPGDAKSPRLSASQWAKKMGSVMLVSNVRVAPPNRLSRSGEWL